MESKSEQSLAILIPMYNEEKGVSKCIDAVVAAIKKIPRKILLIVVNDGSKDKTGMILRQKKKQYQKYVFMVSYKKNRGYGGATQTAIEKARQLGFSWVLHMDSDLTNDPKYISDFVKYLDSDFDCVKASRYIKGGKLIDVPFMRSVISILGNAIARLVFTVGIKDCTNGFRMVRLKKLDEIQFMEKNFSIILEELYFLKKRKAKFMEIPYVLTARVGSVSHFNYKPKIFFDYFKYVFLALFV